MSLKRSSTDPKIPAKRQCVFKDNWLKDNFKNWLNKVDDQTVSCKVCNCNFTIIHEGKTTVNKHAEKSNTFNILEQ